MNALLLLVLASASPSAPVDAVTAPDATPAADVTDATDTATAFDPTSPTVDAAVDHALGLELELDDGACADGDRRRRNRNRNSGGARSSSSGGNFGLGLQLGWPTGITGKFKLGNGQGIQFAIGVGGGAALVGTIDFVWEFFQLFSIPPGHLGLYIGGGAFVGLFPFGYYAFGPVFVSGLPFSLGLEVPFGIDWTFHEIPIDIYAEIAPVLFVVPLGFGFKGSIGARFWF